MTKLVTYLVLFCGLFCLGGQAANLKVNLLPTQAVANGAQWRVDGGAWRTSGTTVKSLSNGSHLVEFKAVAGWTSPTAQTVNLSGGGTTSLNATYSLSAALQIILSPATAQWRINGGAWRASGANVTDLAAGSYQIEYSAQTGYAKPPSETVILAAGQTLSLQRSYEQQARVQLTLTPPEGRWRLNGGTWQNSGDLVYAPAGDHFVEYAELALHDAPAAENISVPAGAILNAARAYVSQRPTIEVTLNPSSGQWRIDGSSWQASGSRLPELEIGAHTLEFSDIGGDYAPLAAETITLELRQNAALTRAYSLKPASVTVTLAPANVRWRIYPTGHPVSETWNDSGTSVANLAPGAYSIDYEPAVGFVTPPTDSLVLSPGQSAALSRSYIALARLQVTLVPDTAQWRVDGSAWQASGSAIYLPGGDHVVEYLSVALYDAQATESIAVGEGETLNISRSYISQRPTLQVNLTPSSAQWRLNGSAWQASGAQLTELDVGEHTVEFSDIGGDYAPLAAETVTLALRDHLIVNRAYALKPASLTITLAPSSGLWRVYPEGTTPGEIWNLSGATVPGLASGLYTIEYEAAAGYDAPPAETVALAPGQVLALTREFATMEPAFRTLHSFTSAGTGAKVVQGSDNRIYVVTTSGSANGVGQIFRINQDGSEFTPLHAFASTADDGMVPTSLIEASDGMLYGTTQNGGASTNNGIVFRLNKDGSGYTILRSFVAMAQGSAPGALTEASDGLLYGTTGFGGAYGAGVIFKMSKDGSGFAVLHPLAGSIDGSRPRGLVEGDDGTLYGVTNSGGQGSAGTVFKIQRDGSGFAVLKTLSSAEGSAPNAPLLQAADGLLYGTTTTGGASGRGVVFRLATNGSAFSIIHTFLGNTTDGGRSETAVIEGPDGRLYGSTATSGPGGRGTIFGMNKDGSGYQTIRSFTGTNADGGSPRSLVITPGGTLFGANQAFGGDASGVIFRLESSGSSFVKLLDLGAPDGALPLAPVTEASDGLLYGATFTGGGSANGAIYRIGKNGTGFSVLHRFTATATGARPQGPIIEASNGLLYGVAGAGPHQYGILFRLNKDGSGFTILHAFGATGDGSYPNDVIEAGDGFLYGTTQGGGASTVGTVFRIAKNGSGYAILRSFSGGLTDGSMPYAGLLDGSDGALYGTTISGGSAGLGVVFRLAKNGSGYAVLHHFAGGANDGATPYAPLCQGGDGRLYGTTTVGSAGYGTVFGLNTDGSGYAILKHFQGGADGASPYYTGLTEQNGMLWGTTNQGGAFLGGTVYRINRDGTGFDIRANLGIDTNDGRVPATGVSAGSDGYFYGTTIYGSTGGTIFRMRSD